MQVHQNPDVYELHVWNIPCSISLEGDIQTSDREAKAVYRAHHRSTRNFYDDEWKSFDQFATYKGFTAATATLLQLAEFTYVIQGISKVQR